MNFTGTIEPGFDWVVSNFRRNGGIVLRRMIPFTNDEL
jgi:hypothetical protein